MSGVILIIIILADPTYYEKGYCKAIFLKILDLKTKND